MSASTAPSRRPQALPVAEAATRSTSPITTTEWGVPEYDDRALYEKLDARRLPGRAVLDHHPAQARQLPPRLRRFRAGEDRALHAEEGRAADAGCRHRAQPPEDRRRGAARRAPISTSWRRARASRALLWDFLDGKPKVNHFRTTEAGAGGDRRCRAQMSKELAARGFKFVGPTIVYAFMQAVGMVNDHLVTCHRHEALRQARRPLMPCAAEIGPRRVRAAARLAAHAVGAPARPARPLAARRRDRGHRARARARGALERPDRGRAHLLGRAAFAAGRDHRAPARRASTAERGSRSCCTTRRNT